jgi:predicted DNA-binding protein (UPF0251 family)
MASKTFDAILSDADYETYEEAADAAGISRHSLWRWRTIAPPKRKSTAIVALARVLKVTPTELLASFRRRVAFAPSRR